MAYTRGAWEGKGPQRRPQKRLGGRLEEGGYCRLQMPWKRALGVGGTVAGHGLGALEGGGRDPIKKQTNANQRECTPQKGISASSFSMPDLVGPQDIHPEEGGGGLPQPPFPMHPGGGGGLVWFALRYWRLTLPVFRAWGR